MKFGAGGTPLPTQMAQTWPTPTVTDAARGNGDQARHGIPLVQRMAATALSGQAPIGSSATTGKRAVPNPSFARWLMGWPAELISGALQGNSIVPQLAAEVIAAYLEAEG